MNWLVRGLLKTVGPSNLRLEWHWRFIHVFEKKNWSEYWINEYLILNLPYQHGASRIRLTQRTHQPPLPNFPNFNKPHSDTATTFHSPPLCFGCRHTLCTYILDKKLQGLNCNLRISKEASNSSSVTLFYRALEAWFTFICALSKISRLDDTLKKKRAAAARKHSIELAPLWSSVPKFKCIIWTVVEDAL